MMLYTGNIRKMTTTLVDGLATYELPISNDLVNMNCLVNKNITLEFNNIINCTNCGRRTKKSYSQGYCYICSQTLARCDLCILRPETCHYHKGTCREPEWGLNNCFIDHIVYLANSSGPKVGITRTTNVPSRFIDQGAVEFLPIIKVGSRIVAGKIEHFLKTFVADKTNWRAMLKNDLTASADLLTYKKDLLKKAMTLIEETQSTVIDSDISHIKYPVTEYPQKITTLNFDKTPKIAGVLKGIKGQYLILDSGVLNIRKFGGYHINLKH